MNPLDYIIYAPLPQYYKEAYEHNKLLGWVATKLTPDSYSTSVIKPGHCGLKHMIDITLPKIDKLKDKIHGFFIIEGDVKIDISYKEFLELNITEPTWLGYKKKQKDYIVGNFLLYFPMTHFEELKEHLKITRLIYSDRFFTKLVEKKWLKLHNKSIAREIPHHSNVLGRWRD